MTITINFLAQAGKFLQIFEILDSENKGQVKTAELVPCLNKILRKVQVNENQNTISNRLIKNLIEIIDPNQIYIQKVDFFGHLMKFIK